MMSGHPTPDRLFSMRSLTISGIGGLCRLEVLDGDEMAADERLFEQLQRNWSRCLTSDEADATVRIRLGAEKLPDVICHNEMRPLIAQSTQAVTYGLIDQGIGSLLMLHAGCVANEEGEAIAFVAPGGTGKTTLMAGLARRYGYVTDETVGIGEGLVIFPYPKPLCIVDRGEVWKSEHGPDELGLKKIESRPQLAKIVLLDRDPALSETVVTPLALFDAIGAIVPQSSSLNKLDQPLHHLAGIIDQTGGVERWSYSEWESLTPLVEGMLGPQ